MRYGKVVLMLAIAALLVAPLMAGEKKEEVKKQTMCPVMGGKIAKAISADHAGKRDYVCCGACPAKFKKNPDKYINKLEKDGVTFAEAPMTICGKCGEVKGGDKCCKKDAKKCPKCKLNKGSLGCCKLSGDGEDAELCAKCGEIKGGDKCCKEGADMCDNCEFHKGSPGCKLKEECKDGSCKLDGGKEGAKCGMCGKKKAACKCGK